MEGRYEERGAGDDSFVDGRVMEGGGYGVDRNAVDYYREDGGSVGQAVMYQDHNWNDVHAKDNNHYLRHPDGDSVE